METKATYQGTRPIVPGHPMWIMKFKTDKGVKKVIKIKYRFLLECLDELNLKTGDKITIKENGKSYSFYK